MGQLLARFIEELRARKVTRVAVTYVAVAFAGLQGMDLVLSPLGGARAYRWVVIGVLAGFPAAVVLAWFYDLRKTRPHPEQAGRAAEPGTVKTRGLSRRRVALVVALVLTGLGLWGYRQVARGQGVMADAEVIAIAPFTTAGATVESLGEGLPQLLSANLDEVGGLRTVDPARVMRAWGEGGAGRRSEAEARELARRLGAGSVLMGSAVAAGNEVRLTSVLRALDGREIAHAQVTGSAADVLQLADSLSNRLLRAIWVSRSPIPQLRISAITTSNLDAIRAYLAGERFYRGLQWDSAEAALQRAVELDSTFALAHRRLASVYGWSGKLDSPLREREVLAAARAPERLPERERAVAMADAFAARREYRSALDSVDSHLRRYSDDADALLLRAEILLHGRVEGTPFAESDSALMAAFEAALRVDQGLVPAMIHPVSLAVRLGDSTRFRRYGTRVLMASETDTAAVPGLINSAIALYWGTGPVSSAFLRRLLTDDALLVLRWEASPLPILIVAGRDPNPAADALARIKLDDVDMPSLTSIAGSLLAMGRLTEGGRVLEILQQRDSVIALRMRMGIAGLGIAPAGFVPRFWPEGGALLGPVGDPVWLAPVQANMDLAQGDTAGAVRALAAATRGAARLPPGADALRRFGAGWLRMLRGEVGAGLAEMEAADAAMTSAPPVATVPPAPYRRAILAMARAGYAPTRKQGIGELLFLLKLVPFTPLVRIHLARALEAEGQRKAAIAQYTTFAVQTRRAEGPMALLNREARTALARLAPPR